MWSYPYAIRNWRDSSRYEIKRSTYQGNNFTWEETWAWEFLRRNADYQRDYDKYKECEFGSLFFGYPGDEPLYKIAKRYGLASHDGMHFPCPKMTDSIIFFGSGWDMETLGADDLFSDPMAANHEYELIVRFDLRRSLNSQLNEVKKKAKEYQLRHGIEPDNGRMGLTKNKKTKYVSYLRVLDALANNASKSEMIEVIAANKSNDYEDGKLARSNIDNWIKSAVALRDGGYLDMLRIPS